MTNLTHHPLRPVCTYLDLPHSVSSLYVLRNAHTGIFRRHTGSIRTQNLPPKILPSKPVTEAHSYEPELGNEKAVPVPVVGKPHCQMNSVMEQDPKLTTCCSGPHQLTGSQTMIDSIF